MKILIADDEPLARRRLRALVDELRVGEVVGEAGNGQQVVLMCEKHVPDIVLLDVRMPGTDGIEAASRISQFASPPCIIFTTAYDEYALQAFDVNAIAYLLKPIRKERLLKAINRAQQLSETQRAVIEKFGDEPPQTISVLAQGGVRLVNLEDILYFAAQSKHVVVYCTDGQRLFDGSLKTLEEQLSDKFIRIHRNALVSVSQIEALERERAGRYKIVLKDTDTKLDVSRRHLSVVREFMKNAGINVMNHPHLRC